MGRGSEDPRITQLRGHLRLQALHRSSKFVPKGIVLDHVVIEGRIAER